MTRSLRARSLHNGLRLYALGLTAIAALWHLLAPASSRAGELDFPPTADYTLRSADGSQVIGHAHFGVTTDSDGLTTMLGEYRYLDGTYDIDKSTVRPGVAGNPPTLVRTVHSFFLAGGAPEREGRVDVAAGVGSCTIDVNGTPQVSSAKIDFPADTFAGDTVILPLRRYVASGATGSIGFHAFNCIPGPKLLKVTATASAPAPWDFYPGNLIQVDVKPDFGWINVVIAPFLPHIRAWFDPGDNWFFVGGETARYYKGLKYMMVRIRPENAVIKAVPKAPPAPN